MIPPPRTNPAQRGNGTVPQHGDKVLKQAQSGRNENTAKTAVLQEKSNDESMEPKAVNSINNESAKNVSGDVLNAFKGVSAVPSIGTAMAAIDSEKCVPTQPGNVSDHAATAATLISHKLSLAGIHAGPTQNQVTPSTQSEVKLSRGTIAFQTQKSSSNDKQTTSTHGNGNRPQISEVTKELPRKGGSASTAIVPITLNERDDTTTAASPTFRRSIPVPVENTRGKRRGPPPRPMRRFNPHPGLMPFRGPGLSNKRALAYAKFGSDARLTTELNDPRERDVPHDGNSRRMVPSFHSPWAGVPAVQRHEFREEQIAPRRQIPLTRILDGNRLAVGNNWSLRPVEDMAFNLYVDISHDEDRPDLLRYRKLIEKNGEQHAKDVWSQMAQARYWYQVPKFVVSDRTFARDEFDCYYLDAMKTYLDNRRPWNPQRLPIFADPLMNRWWNAMRLRPEFLYEYYCRTKFGLMVPYDSFEVSLYDIRKLQEEFPAVPDWMAELNQPAGLPLPLPPVVYYFGIEMAASGDRTARGRILWKIFEVEFAALFASFWWNEATHGGRQIILNGRTIEFLSRALKDVDVAHGKVTRSLIAEMHTAANLSAYLRNPLIVSIDGVENTQFIQCQKRTGEIDSWTPGGNPAFYDTRCGRLRLVLRQQMRFELLHSSPMQLTVDQKDQQSLRGLEDFVKSHQHWGVTGVVTVRNLVERLLIVNSNQKHHLLVASGEVQKLRDQVEEGMQREHNLLRRENEVAKFARYLAPPPNCSVQFEDHICLNSYSKRARDDRGPPEYRTCNDRHCYDKRCEPGTRYDDWSNDQNHAPRYEHSDHGKRIRMNPGQSHRKSDYRDSQDRGLSGERIGPPHFAEPRPRPAAYERSESLPGPVTFDDVPVPRHHGVSRDFQDYGYAPPRY